MARVLVVDDDLSMREFLDLMLSREGYDVVLASDGQAALELVAQNKYELVITDIRMKDVDGIAVLKGVKAVHSDTVVILISAFATVETAVVAMKEGAYDFIPKPFRIEDMKAVIRGALSHRSPEDERKKLEEKVKEGCHFGSLVGLSTPMLQVYELIRRASQTDTNILISGESGTGKELVARAVHDNSPRSHERFVAINCGGMPEPLIESELFGYRKGAFTGANMDKPGLFELAHRGTIFLDELGELTMSMQVKLLRVAQDKTYRAVGDTTEHLLDIRFIAATNKELETEVINGRFREDLYYRMNVINIHMPPLRDRKDDIPLLAQYFLEKYSRAQKKDVRKISAFALDILSHYDFPGNVRELENIIERSVALEQSSIVLPESLNLATFKQQRRLAVARSAEPTLKPTPKPAAKTGLRELLRGNLDDTLAIMERLLLLRALAGAGGRRKQAAKLLGINQRSMRYRVSKHDIREDSAEALSKQLNQAEAQAGSAGPLNPPWVPGGMSMDEALLKAERHLLDLALEEAGGSKTRAAELLGINFRSIRYRVSKFDSAD